MLSFSNLGWIGLLYLVVLAFGVLCTFKFVQQVVIVETPLLTIGPLGGDVGLALYVNVRYILERWIPNNQLHDHHLDDDNGLSLRARGESPIGGERV